MTSTKHKEKNMNRSTKPSTKAPQAHTPTLADIVEIRRRDAHSQIRDTEQWAKMEPRISRAEQDRHILLNAYDQHIATIQALTEALEKANKRVGQIDMAIAHHSGSSEALAYTILNLQGRIRILEDAVKSAMLVVNFGGVHSIADRERLEMLERDARKQAALAQAKQAQP